MSLLDRPGVARTRALVRHDLMLFAREPGPIVARVVQPLVLVPVLHPLYASALDDGARGATQLVVGFLVLFSLLGMSVVANAIVAERVWRTFDRLRATPARPVQLIAGKVAPALLFLLTQQVMILFLGILVLDVPVVSHGLLAVTVVVWAVTILCLGSLIAVVVRSYAELSTVTDIGAFVLAAFGGALVPLSAMPGWVRGAAPASPGYWAVEGLHAALAGDVPTALTAWAVLTGVATVCATAAAMRLARGWGGGTLL